MPRLKTNPIERFHTSYEIDPISGCYNWTGYKDIGGYGRFKHNRKMYLPHRWIYEYLNGPIPEGLVVRHQCHNPACVNPEHLLLGTPQDNSDDMIKANRSPRGEKNPKSILTEQDVILIKKFLKRQNERGVGTFLSRWFNVSRNTISDIKFERSWSYLEV